MTKKSGGGLAAFKTEASAPATRPAPKTQEKPDKVPGQRAARGTSDRVAVAVRLEKEDWFRLHDFANRNNTTLQALIVKSLSKTMEDMGFAALQGDGK